MTSRRGFLAGLLASGMVPQLSWADAGLPDFLAAARFPDGSYKLAGVTGAGEVVFTLPIPDRGHAAAAHPFRPEAVGFARRPGDFALVIDCAQGRDVARLSAPAGRHFYGHGVFSKDGSRLYTTENDYDAAEGMIGVWDAASGYARLGEFPSGGVGPHDIVLLPDGETLAVANGGIETHPASGRSKLNIPVMMPNLTYLSRHGAVQEVVELAPELHKNSIRHLAVGQGGTVCFAMQWQGAMEETPALIAHHRLGQDPVQIAADPAQLALMKNYAGSVALSADAQQVAYSSPRGGRVHLHDLGTGALIAAPQLEDVCGLGAYGTGFLFTTGKGVIGLIEDGQARVLTQHDCQWDNHLVKLG
ncbi:MAG: DUF1513 domain-containing protein [Pelagimonas sp.]|jgi:hypothetical protein|nr:DUF1513 domain-containing protein [Pelagimonas sp.]